MNLRNIAKGFWLDFVGAPEQVKEVAQTREAICRECPNVSINAFGVIKCNPKRWVDHVDNGEPNLIEMLKQKGIKSRVHNGRVQARGCGCYLSKKTLVMEDECPAGKWKPIWRNTAI